MLETVVVLLLSLGLFFFFAAIICAGILGCVSRVRQYWLDRQTTDRNAAGFWPGLQEEESRMS